MTRCLWSQIQSNGLVRQRVFPVLCWKPEPPRVQQAGSTLTARQGDLDPANVHFLCVSESPDFHAIAEPSKRKWGLLQAIFSLLTWAMGLISAILDNSSLGVCSWANCCKTLFIVNGEELSWEVIHLACFRNLLLDSLNYTSILPAYRHELWKCIDSQQKYSFPDYRQLLVGRFLIVSHQIPCANQNSPNHTMASRVNLVPFTFFSWCLNFFR